jgi:hypothetical protein
MKSLKFPIIILVTSILAFVACRDESVNPVPAWETALHGFGSAGFTKDSAYTIQSKTKSKIDGKDSFFIEKKIKNWVDTLLTSKPTRPYRFDHYWQSLDKLNTATKVEFFVYWDENYVDANGNSKVKRHGGYIFDEPGKLFKTISSPKESRGVENLKITQTEIADLYKSSPAQNTTGRTATNPFTKRDVFHIRWAITAADGRKFERWDPTGICVGEVLGANCQLDIPVK